MNRLDVHNQSHRNLMRQVSRLKEKTALAAENTGIVLDEESDHLIRDTIISPIAIEHFKDLPRESFQHVFWQQHVEATSKPNLQNMHWHPLMIQWCLYLRYR